MATKNTIKVMVNRFIDGNKTSTVSTSISSPQELEALSVKSNMLLTREQIELYGNSFAKSLCFVTTVDAKTGYTQTVESKQFYNQLTGESVDNTEIKYSNQSDFLPLGRKLN